MKGASVGEGLGNQFLVVRGFADSEVVHVDGKVNPADDLATITAELALADLQTLDRAIPRYEKELRGKRIGQPVLDAALAAQDSLQRGIPLSASTGIGPAVR